jgi:hypothetical protein
LLLTSPSIVIFQLSGSLAPPESVRCCGCRISRSAWCRRRAGFPASRPPAAVAEHDQPFVLAGEFQILRALGAGPRRALRLRDGNPAGCLRRTALHPRSPRPSRQGRCRQEAARLEPTHPRRARTRRQVSRAFGFPGA